jgi:hypothetical protein
MKLKKMIKKMKKWGFIGKDSFYCVCITLMGGPMGKLNLVERKIYLNTFTRNLKHSYCTTRKVSTTSRKKSPHKPV